MDSQSEPAFSDNATDSIYLFYDLIIIGGGPAGAAAAVYAGRKKLQTLVITESFGGQSIVAADIQNWIGEPHISGLELSKKLEAHVREYSETVQVNMPERVQSIKTILCQEQTRICDFKVTTDKGVYQCKSLIIVSGARRKKLGVPGEDKFEGKGVSFCSTCDAPLFSGKKVAVIGGGNAGLEAVQDLFAYASEIYILETGESLRGDPKTQEEIRGNANLKQVILNAQVLEILGENLVSAVKYKDLKNNEEKSLEVDGIFVEIGSIPNSEIVKDLVQLDQYGQIMINPKNVSTSHPGIFAAGDVTDDPYKQNNISAGDAIRAALAAYDYLLKRQKESPAAEGA